MRLVSTKESEEYLKSQLYAIKHIKDIVKKYKIDCDLIKNDWRDAPEYQRHIKCRLKTKFSWAIVHKIRMVNTQIYN